MKRTYTIIQGTLLRLVSSCSLAQISQPVLSDASVTTQASKYTNPITRDTAISMRHHFIIQVDKKWYYTGTYEPVRTGGTRA